MKAHDKFFQVMQDADARWPDLKDEPFEGNFALFVLKKVGFNILCAAAGASVIFLVGYQMGIWYQ